MSEKLLFDKLVAVAECMDLHRKLESVEGWLHPYEAICLYTLAALGEGSGEVVELGSYLGRSTCAIALGLRDGRRGMVYAVDHHQGSPEHREGGKYESKEIATQGSTYPRFMENIQRMGVYEHVEPLVMTTLEAVDFWKAADSPPIRLLFIDASHEYEDVKRDWLAWSPFVQKSGMVAFHDVGDKWAGVDKAFQEAMATPGWEPFCGFHHLHVIRRIKDGDADQPVDGSAGLVDGQGEA